MQITVSDAPINIQRGEIVKAGRDRFLVSGEPEEIYKGTVSVKGFPILPDGGYGKEKFFDMPSEIPVSVTYEDSPQYA